MDDQENPGAMLVMACAIALLVAWGCFMWGYGAWFASASLAVGVACGFVMGSIYGRRS